MQFRTLEIAATPTNVANQVKLGHAPCQSHSVQSPGPEITHQRWWALKAIVDNIFAFFEAVWVDYVAIFVCDKNNTQFWMSYLTMIVSWT